MEAWSATPDLTNSRRPGDMAVRIEAATVAVKGRWVSEGVLQAASSREIITANPSERLGYIE